MIKHNFPGKFIVIEGLDGSGKSAQVDLLATFLQEKGKEFILKNEPTTESEAGLKIKRVLRKEITVEPLEMQKLYVQDRTEHLANKIVPALTQGKFVVCSRYAFSTVAYGHANGLDAKHLMELNDHFLLPDLTIVIQVPPEECIKRIEKRGEGKELFDKKKRLEKANEIYKKLPTMYKNVVLVNGMRPIGEVFGEIKSLVSNLI